MKILGSECDAYVRIASQFSPAELADMSNFVQGLFKFYLESKYQVKFQNFDKNSILEKIYPWEA